MRRSHHHNRNTVIALSSSFMPMAEITRRKAIKAIVSRKADLVVNPKTLETSTEVIPGIPIKMIIYRMITKSPGEPKLHNGNKGLKAIIRRDGHRCCYCGCKVKTSVSLSHPAYATVDHILPRAQGGKTVWKNLCCSCLRCNQTKGNKTPEQANMPLLRKPTTPTMILMERMHRLIESDDVEMFQNPLF